MKTLFETFEKDFYADGNADENFRRYIKKMLGEFFNDKAIEVMIEKEHKRLKDLNHG